MQPPNEMQHWHIPKTGKDALQAPTTADLETSAHALNEVR